MKFVLLGLVLTTLTKPGQASHQVFTNEQQKDLDLIVVDVGFTAAASDSAPRLFVSPLLLEAKMQPDQQQAYIPRPFVVGFFGASIEILGKGTFGTTYKVALEDSTDVVVKRLKEVNVTLREFEQQMEIVGSIRHENVVPLRAYYYSIDEKLTLYDYSGQDSVSSMLRDD
ncbi:hypothetical protein L1887_23466 [Cichorium endivia]|nr:hypothetical protein L1887_23466 [Cichorium endivia]